MRLKHFALVALLVAVGATMHASTVGAQREPAFTNPLAFDQSCDSSPPVVREAIEAECTQEQIDAIQARVIPTPTDEEIKQRLEQIEADLRQIGHDAIADDVQAERDKLPAAIESTERPQ